MFDFDGANIELVFLIKLSDLATLSSGNGRTVSPPSIVEKWLNIVTSVALFPKIVYICAPFYDKPLNALNYGIT